jgi:hypothetical protein
VGNEPEKDREHEADDKTGHDRKIERGVFASVHDVAGQLSEAERELIAEIKKDADKNKKRSEENKRATEFAKRLHKDNFTRSGK